MLQTCIIEIQDLADIKAGCRKPPVRIRLFPPFNQTVIYNPGAVAFHHFHVCSLNDGSFHKKGNEPVWRQLLCGADIYIMKRIAVCYMECQNILPLGQLALITKYHRLSVADSFVNHCPVDKALKGIHRCRAELRLFRYMFQEYRLSEIQIRCIQLVIPASSACNPPSVPKAHMAAAAPLLPGLVADPDGLCSGGYIRGEFCDWDFQNRTLFIVCLISMIRAGRGKGKKIPFSCNPLFLPPDISRKGRFCLSDCIFLQTKQYVNSFSRFQIHVYQDTAAGRMVSAHLGGARLSVYSLHHVPFFNIQKDRCRSMAERQHQVSPLIAAVGHQIIVNIPCRSMIQKDVSGISVNHGCGRRSQCSCCFRNTADAVYIFPEDRVPVSVYAASVYSASVRPVPARPVPVRPVFAGPVPASLVPASPVPAGPVFVSQTGPVKQDAASGLCPCFQLFHGFFHQASPFRKEEHFKTLLPQAQLSVTYMSI
ncbi:predicted protein [Enterocloster bolteae CAG:59]|nr:predicted protein [Enterocloster bolteae CAG:59]